MPPKKTTKKTTKKGTGSGRPGDPRPQVGGGKKGGGKKGGGKKPPGTTSGKPGDPRPGIGNKPPPKKPPEPDTELEHEEDFKGGKAPEPGSAWALWNEYKAGNYDPALVTEEYALANPMSPEAVAFHQTHEQVEGEWVQKTTSSDAWQNFMGSWYAADAQGNPVALVHNADNTWTNPATGENLGHLLDYRAARRPGGDFDEDGNFVGGGQGGFDEDGNPVGGGGGGGAGAGGVGGAPGIPQSEIDSGVAEWNGFLQQWGLQALEPFIREAITKGWSFNQIQQEIRNEPAYLQAFPENGIRRQKGFSFIPEAQILEYRNEARRIAKTVLGIDVSNAEIANLVGNDVSVREWEENLRVWKDFQRWGPTVRGVLESELGPIADDRMFAFLHPGIPTPELDRAYETALYRGRPALLGLGVRPEDEAETLRRFGIDVNQAFRGYQGVAAELPRAERMAFIEQAVNSAPGLPANGSALFTDTPFATLFRAIQLGDAEAIRILQDQMERETARNTQGGGAAFQGAAAVGLASPAERARL